MIVDEKWFAGFFESNPFVKWAFIIIIIIGVVFFGKAKQKQQLVLSHNDGIFTIKGAIHMNSAFYYLFSFPSGVVLPSFCFIAVVIVILRTIYWSESFRCVES